MSTHDIFYLYQYIQRVLSYIYIYIYNMQRRTKLIVAVFIMKITTSPYTECGRCGFLASRRPSMHNYVSTVSGWLSDVTSVRSVLI
jgi:hypothetical protein